MIKLEEIRNRIHDAIQYSRKQQKELANQIAVCPQEIRQYMHYGQTPSLETFANL